MDTIFALASASGRAGVSVVRVSGAGVPRLAGRLFSPVDANGRGVRILRSKSDEPIDQALVLHFSEGQSFTGQETVELHLHGSVAVIAAVLKELGTYDGFRLAEPGEFTRLAFDGGRLDLAEVEGLSDLIDAETESQRKQSLAVLTGALSDQVEEWRSTLLRVSALFMAAIDFADEEIPDTVLDEARELILGLIRSFQNALAGAGASERIRDGFEVAIVGVPNAGKSTLLNRLAGREAAITSSHAGTTRDIIEVRMDIAGLPVTLLDTAGLREGQSEVEEIGIDRAIERAKAADIRVFLKVSDEELPIRPIDGDVVLRAKADLGDADVNGVSGLTGQGIDALIANLEQELSTRVSGSGLIIRERHRVAISRSLSDLEQALDLLSDQDDIALTSEMILSSVRAMDQIVGRVSVDSVLGEIFSSFCIGK